MVVNTLNKINFTETLIAIFDNCNEIIVVCNSSANFVLIN